MDLILMIVFILVICLVAGVGLFFSTNADSIATKMYIEQPLQPKRKFHPLLRILLYVILGLVVIPALGFLLPKQGWGTEIFLYFLSFPIISFLGFIISLYGQYHRGVIKGFIRLDVILDSMILHLMVIVGYLLVCLRVLCK